MALGYIAAFSDTLALAVIVHQGLLPLKDALMNESEDYIKAASAWTLGQIGRHTPDHAKALAQADIYRKLIDIYADASATDDLKSKAERALKATIQKCTHLPALEPLLHDTPYKVLKYVVQQFAKVLPNDPEGRKSFVQSGGLQKIQELKADDNANAGLMEYISAINNCFPPEVVNYYCPNYASTLLQKVDEFNNTQ